MSQKHFFAAFLVFSSFSLQVFATDVENDNGVVSPRFRDIWPIISSKLTEEKDIVRLSRVCKLTHEATQFATAWEGVAQKYHVKPSQVLNFLMLLVAYKGKQEIEVSCLGSYDFFNLERSYVETFEYTKASVAPNRDLGLLAPALPLKFIKVTDYVRLKVENEEMMARKYKLRVTFEPIEFSFELGPINMEKFFIKLEDEN